jgi:predicted transposase YbfD/YdcC
MATQDLISLFGDMPDPRLDRKKLHKLSDILSISILAVICGADSWVDIQNFGLARYEWLSVFLELGSGIPSHDTFRRVFSLIDPKEFEKRFAEWTGTISGKLTGQIAIDGKVIRGSGNRRNKKDPLCIVSAWSSELNLVLAHTQVKNKSNEITAIPELLQMLTIQGCIVSIDAMGCQKSIAEEIVNKGGDYVLAVKGNQQGLHDEIGNFFDQAEAIDFKGVAHDMHMSFEKNRGRKEERYLYVTEEIDWLPMKDGWKGIKSIVCLHSHRTEKEKTTTEKRYYISTLNANAQDHVKAVRNHWGIENKQHWVLDVGFNEDQCRIREKISGENLATLRRLALNLLKLDKTIKAGVKGKRLRAAWDPKYLAKLIA